jgi:hypothetical protein
MAEKQQRDASPTATLTNGKAETNHGEGCKTSALEKAQALEAEHAIDPAIDARVTRNCDLRIIPWLFGLW